MMACKNHLVQARGNIPELAGQVFQGKDSKDISRYSGLLLQISRLLFHFIQDIPVFPGQERSISLPWLRVPQNVLILPFKLINIYLLNVTFMNELHCG